MKFTDDQIRIEPGRSARTWQSCDYFVGDQHLFHERTSMRTATSRRDGSPLAQLLWLAGGRDTNVQWFDGLGTLAEIQALAKKHGGRAEEDFYPEDPNNPAYFLAFDDTEKALAFCRSEDFDRLCLTLAKLP